jgi:hypothetical protein
MAEPAETVLLTGHRPEQPQVGRGDVLVRLEQAVRCDEVP